MTDEKTRNSDHSKHLTPALLAYHWELAQTGQAPQLVLQSASCPTCWQSLETLGFWIDELDHQDPRFAFEFLTRYGFFTELMATVETAKDRLQRLREESLFHHWGLGQLLLRESREARSKAYALELCELAEAVGRNLESEFYGDPWIADFRSRTAVQKGALLLAEEDLPQAEAALRQALDLAAIGTRRTRTFQAVTELATALGQDGKVSDLEPDPKADQPHLVRRLLELGPGKIQQEVAFYGSFARFRSRTDE